MSPHVLVGESTSHRIVESCTTLGWGRMWVYRNIRPISGERWGFDNGVFKTWDRTGPMRREQFDVDGYLWRVDRAHKVGTPYLAVVPDLIAAGNASLDFSLEWRTRLPRECHFIWRFRTAWIVSGWKTIWLAIFLAESFWGVQRNSRKRRRCGALWHTSTGHVSTMGDARRYGHGTAHAQ